MVGSSQQSPTFFLRNHQNNARLMMTRAATTGPAIAPGLIPPPEDEGFLLHWIVGHCEQVLHATESVQSTALPSNTVKHVYNVLTLRSRYTVHLPHNCIVDRYCTTRIHLSRKGTLRFRYNPVWVLF